MVVTIGHVADGRNGSLYGSLSEPVGSCIIKSRLA
jgi:hypothetical protein